jgi:hypothetical protein
MRVGPAALALLLCSPVPALADWQLKPFFGATFGGSTTLVDLEHAAGKPNVAIGVSGVLLGETLGLEADLDYGPGFFQSGPQHLVVRSRVTTVTGNVVVAVPRRLTAYTLRPYVVGGAGLMRARSQDAFGPLSLASDLPAMDVGGGVTGFLTHRLGLGWDVRYFRSFGGRDQGRGLSFGAERLSFWRANMALAIRY